MWTLVSVVSSFFFSSRRRHTRLQGDWSSDVCSSDLGLPGIDLCPVQEEAGLHFQVGLPIGIRLSVEDLVTIGNRGSLLENTHGRGPLGVGSDLVALRTIGVGGGRGLGLFAAAHDAGQGEPAFADI